MESNPHIITTICTNQVRSKGGSTAAQNMSPEQRRARALKANHAKKCYSGLLKATHDGILEIAESKISCAVLENGQRVINETSMFEILGRKRKGRGRQGTEIPGFLDAMNLKPFINNCLMRGPQVIQYLGKNSGKSYGYEATIIPEICKVYLDARKAGVLTPSQLPTAEKAEIILHSLAKVGIIALVDAASGYEKDRENDELQKLFEKFIAKELQPWTKRFPPEYFENIKRIYGLSHLKRSPSFAGHLINRYIYSEISEDVLEELKRKNPVTDSGRRKHAHHQFLTHDVGHPALNKQILKINTLMSASDTKEEFESLFEKTRRK